MVIRAPGGRYLGELPHDSGGRKNAGHTELDFQGPLSRPAGQTAEEEPPRKRPRKETEDAKVPASRESSEETLSSDETPVLAKGQLICDTFCSSLPSTSRVGLEEVKNSRGSLSPSHSTSTKASRKEAENSQNSTERKEEKETETVETEAPSSSRVKEREAKDIYVRKDPSCAWDECTQNFYNVNLLYDHVMEVHIHPVGNRTEGRDGVLECLWGDCEMSILRGDWAKKTKWLEEHYRTRHAKNAQAVKCVIEQCTFRCNSYGKLDEHVRKVHIEKPAEKAKESSKSKEDKAKADTACERPPQLPIMSGEFPWNEYYVGVIVERQQKRREMNRQCEWVLKRRPGHGAAHRKARAPLQGEFVLRRPKPQPEVYTGPKTDESLTLEDLFPGWGYKSPLDKPSPKKSPPPKVIEMDDIPPQLEPISPLPIREPEDFPPILAPILSLASSSAEEESIDFDPCSLPSLDRYPTTVEQDCSKCLEQLLDVLQ